MCYCPTGAVTAETGGVATDNQVVHTLKSVTDINAFALYYVFFFNIAISIFALRYIGIYQYRIWPNIDNNRYE